MKKDKILFLSNIKDDSYKYKNKVKNVIYKYKWLSSIIGIIFILYLITVVFKSYFVKWQSLYGSLVGVGATILGVNLTMSIKYKEVYKKILFQIEKCQIINEIGNIRMTDKPEILFSESVKVNNVYIGVNRYKLNDNDVYYLEQLAIGKNKENILNFVENVESELKNNLVGRLNGLIVYVNALERIKDFILNYKLVFDENCKLDKKYEYCVSVRNTSNYIYANMFSLMLLRKFVTACQDINQMKNQLKKGLY